MLERPPMFEWGAWPYWKALNAEDSCGKLPAERAAAGFCNFLKEATVSIFPGELVVGALAVRDQTEEERAADKSGTIGLGRPPCTIDGHYGLDLERVVHVGLDRLRKQVAWKLEKSPAAEGKRTEAHFFYRAALDCLDAAIAYCEELVRVVDQERDGESSPERRAELAEIARVCCRVPRKPARTFHEAVQAIWTVHLLSRIENGLCVGRLDRVLWPFYDRDLGSGALTRERAAELVAALLIKYNEFGTWPQGALLGGLDTTGKDRTSDLSLLILEVFGELALANPALAISYNSQTPDDLLRAGVRHVCQGQAVLSLFNDEVVIPSLLNAGVAIEDAVQYLHSTCVEITTQGTSGIRVVANYISFPRLVLLALHNGRDVTDEKRDGPATGEPQTFEDFVAAVKEQLAHELEINAINVNKGVLGHPWARRYPFSSCFVRNCLERGKDWSDGGPKYNFIYPQLVGFPTGVDSMLAVRDIVFRERQRTFAEFVAALEADFAEDEPLRTYIVERLPKYGNDDEQADQLARDLFGFYCGEVKRYRSPQGAAYYPGFLNWVMHANLGKQCPATPDGRRPRTAFSDSMSAVQGRARGGLTAEIQSVTKLNYRGALGGMVYNLVINRTMYGSDEGVEKLMQLLKTYFAQGGFQVQVSVVDRETLLQAQRNPESFRHLMVKVGGYSDYFVTLSPELQEALIAKAE